MGAQGVWGGVVSKVHTVANGGVLLYTNACKGHKNTAAGHTHGWGLWVGKAGEMCRQAGNTRCGGQQTERIMGKYKTKS